MPAKKLQIQLKPADNHAVNGSRRRSVATLIQTEGMEKLRFKTSLVDRVIE